MIFNGPNHHFLEQFNTPDRSMIIIKCSMPQMLEIEGSNIDIVILKPLNHPILVISKGVFLRNKKPGGRHFSD